MSKLHVRKRRHHYVWKHYLRAWARGERIFSRLGNKVLEEKLESVAQERDFYELKTLTDEDINFIREFVIQQALPHLRSSHENALRLYVQAQHAVAMSRDLAADNPTISQSADALASNFTEEWHTSLERDAASHLDELRNGSMAFYGNTQSCLDFTLFLATQYFRTKAVKEASIASLNAFAGNASPSRMWDLLAHLFASNVAWSLFAERHDTGLRLLRNETDTDFITADQPVINLAASEERTQRPPEQMTLYYPITPRMAVIAGDLHADHSWPPVLTEAVVQSLNSRMTRQCLLRVFAKRKEDLPLADEA